MSDIGFPSTPWEAEEPDKNDLAHVWASDGDLVATVTESLPHGETHMDRAELIAAAGNSGHEAAKMGYDPVEAVEALPKILQAAQELIESAEQDVGNNAFGGQPPKLLESPARETIDNLKDALTSAESSGKN